MRRQAYQGDRKLLNCRLIEKHIILTHCQIWTEKVDRKRLFENVLADIYQHVNLFLTIF